MSNLGLIKLKNQMNASQMELFERLIAILPEMKGKNLVEILVAMHILGISEDDRINRTLSNLNLPKGVKIEDKKN